MPVKPVKTLVLLLISIYQYAISPLMGRNCRFYPSCSAYAKESIEYRGLLAGSVLTIKRLFRCHPWHPGGYDPVLRDTIDEKDVKQPLTNRFEHSSYYSAVDKTTTPPNRHYTDSVAQ